MNAIHDGICSSQRDLLWPGKLYDQLYQPGFCYNSQVVRTTPLIKKPYNAHSLGWESWEQWLFRIRLQT